MIAAANEPGAHSARGSLLLKVLLILAFTGLNWAYFKIMFGSLPDIVWCCDASSYIQQSDLIAESGLLARFEWAGYRSYFNYAAVSAVRVVGAAVGFVPDAMPATSLTSSDISYSAGAFISFIGIGTGLILRFAGTRRFWHVFLPLCCNPLLFSYIPYPLQEGQAVLLLLPLAAWALLSHFNEQRLSTVVSVSLVIGVGWMIKSAYLLAVLPVALFLVLVILRRGMHWRNMALLTVISAVVVALPIAPQIVSSLTYFGSPLPYPNDSLLTKQLAWGWEMWRYDTYFDPEAGHFRGLRFPTPFKSGDENTFSFVEAVVQRPFAAIALAFGHVFGAFNYANPKVYSPDYILPAFSLINLMVGSIIFLGLYGSVLAWRHGVRRLENILIEGLILGNAAVLPFIAVETRFSVLSLAFLSLRTGEVVSTRLSGQERALLIVGTTLFSVAFVLIGTLMFQITSIPMDPQ